MKYLFFILICSTFAANSKPPKDKKKVRISPLPIFSYAPETSFTFGGLGIVNFKLKQDSLTRDSYVQSYFQYTLNKQYEFSTIFTLFSPSER